MVWFDNRSSVSTNSNNRRAPRRTAGSVYSSNHSRHSAPSLYPGASSSKGYNYGYSTTNNKDVYGYTRSSTAGSHSGRRSKSPTMSVFSTSSSRRSVKPRSGFVHRVLRSIKKLLHNIHRYARRHPIKTFVVVIVPLVLSGVLQKLLGLVGLHLPRSTLGWFAGPKPGQGLVDHIVSVFRAAKMVV